MKLKFIALAAVAVSAITATSAEARTQMRAVGSSTVYPFAKVVAERIARANPKLGTPIIELTGTGAGMKLFCAGVGGRFPDVEHASRRMKASEAKDCLAHGVTQITEIQIGIDGLTLATSKSSNFIGTEPARHLRRARQDAVGQAQPRQDLEGRQRQASGNPDPRLRAAADQRHARLAQRTDHERRLRDERRDDRAQEGGRKEVQGASARDFAKTARSFRPARTTI